MVTEFFKTLEIFLGKLDFLNLFVYSAYLLLILKM